MFRIHAQGCPCYVAIIQDKMNELFILMPVHNRKEITRRSIACLRQQTHQDYHLVLIDDGSTDGTAEMVQAQIPSVTILRGNGNWWWGGSLHQGYLWLKSQTLPPSAMVLTLNDDAVFDPEYLSAGVVALRQTKGTLIVSTGYGEQSGNRMDGGVHADWIRWTFLQEMNPGRINCASTRGLFLYVSDFMRIGGFHPRLLPHYSSDYEFTIRAVRKGYTLLVDERLKLSVNERTTGISHFRDERSYAEFIKKMFSKKYNLNPFYLSNFVALACPWPWKVLNWARVWSSTAWKIVRYFFLLILFKRDPRISQ
jgi:GT2 family glycosyltransferase